MDMIDTLYRFAKFQFECGNYSGSAEYLYIVRVLVRLLLLLLHSVAGSKPLHTKHTNIPHLPINFSI